MNTYDIVGAIELTASAAILIASLIVGLELAGRSRIAAVSAYVGWFGLIVLLAAKGIFAAQLGIGIGGVGAAVAVPVVLGLWAGNRLGGFRSALAKLPLTVLIGVNSIRALGISFILLYSAGRLPAPFAPVAGWGDVAIGLTALPVAWLARRRRSGSMALVLGWNVLGLLDLFTAVGLGVTSAPGSPLRLFFAEPGTGIMGQLPWVLIPAFLVPNLILTHFAIFRKISEGRAFDSSPTLSRLGAASGTSG